MYLHIYIFNKINWFIIFIHKNYGNYKTTRQMKYGVCIVYTLQSTDSTRWTLIQIKIEWINYIFIWIYISKLKLKWWWRKIYLSSREIVADYMYWSVDDFQLRLSSSGEERWRNRQRGKTINIYLWMN